VRKVFIQKIMKINMGKVIIGVLALVFLADVGRTEGGGFGGTFMGRESSDR
jgi:hypothetical protein